MHSALVSAFCSSWAPDVHPVRYKVQGGSVPDKGGSCAHYGRTSNLRFQCDAGNRDVVSRQNQGRWRRQFCLVAAALFLFFSCREIRAQILQESSGDACPSTTLKVMCPRGMPVVNALVKDDKNRMQYRTDSNGNVEISCVHYNTDGQVFEIRAAGFKTRQVAVPAGSGGNVPVMLERSGQTRQLDGNTTSVIELSQQRQDRLASLQRAIEKAFAIKDYDGAERMLLEALNLNPSAAWIANDLGIAALQHGNYDAAELWFDKAVEFAPFNPNIIGNCGLLRWMQHRTEESHALLSRAASLGFKSSFGLYVHGILDLERGQFNEARENLQSLSADKYPDRDLYLSFVWRGLGKTKAADKSYLNYLRHNPVPLIPGNLTENGRR